MTTNTPNDPRPGQAPGPTPTDVGVLKGYLRKPTRSATLDEMRRAIVDGAVERFRRSQS